MTERAYDYVLIVGHGRSGTNWLLRLLDLSPVTHCRNEPNEIKDAPLAKLTPSTVARPHEPELDAKWDGAISWAASHIGERDPPVRTRKDHIYELTRRLGLRQILERRKVRTFLSLFMPSLRGSEWPPARWLGSRAAFRRATPVLKFAIGPA